MADKIEMSVEGVRAAVNKVRSTIADQAEAAKTKLNSHHVPPGKLGPTAQAAAFIKQHDTAQQLYVDTINQVLGDLENFAQALSDSADVVERKDENARDSLAKLDPSRLAPQTQTVYLDEVSEHGNVLDPGQKADDAADRAQAAPVTVPIADPVPTIDGGQGSGSDAY